jgi:predicted secreted hydrolase
VLPGRKLVFPADHGAHPQFRTEWWYATGWLTLPDGRPLGFQTTFFRVRTGIGEASESAFAPRQLLLAHGAIADPRSGKLHADERAARVMPGRAGFETGRTAVWVGVTNGWRMELKDDRYVAAVTGRDFAYALTLTPRGPPILNGLNGFSRKAPEARHASFYYSRPQLAVNGTVTLAGKQQPVTGMAWLDHEWSSELLPDGAQGWDWVGLNFDDGSALMAFRMRAAEGGVIWSAATITTASGVVTMPARGEFAFEPQRTWTSPRTAIRYPVAWNLRVGSRIWQLQPLMDDQELDSRRSTGAVYWEGAVRVIESGREVGRGYLEMTGYGERIRVN